MTKEDISKEMNNRRGRGRYGERRLATKVKGVVVGKSKGVKLPSGKWIQIKQPNAVDVVTDMFGFESKWLVKVPANIRKVMTQAVRNCPEGLTPVGVIGDRQNRVVYYILMEGDFLELHIG